MQPLGIRSQQIDQLLVGVQDVCGGPGGVWTSWASTCSKAAVSAGAGGHPAVLEVVPGRPGELPLAVAFEFSDLGHGQPWAPPGRSAYSSVVAAGTYLFERCAVDGLSVGDRGRGQAQDGRFG
ncbi:hypothetical protein Sfulv_05530 [Streptomyces fulvorobeus]|uniref:Uncharacterized protein n=1 Tax=Streptomyces fulvorobeus TaxID=284028 RepID=A0A7J0BZR6_9ACTN|nr:hypothetical protein Sfulv_05530 [Streptomyces fulvorobeus]